MNPLREFFRRVRVLFGGRQFNADLEEEMRLHLQLREEEFRDHGINTPRKAAYTRFGNPTLLKEKSYMTWGWASLESFFKDIRYGIRSMLRSPGLLAVALLSLALGIGANTAIFSFLDAVLLRNLPVKNPSQLVLLGTGTWGGITDSWAADELYSYPFYRDLQKENSVFSDVTTICSMVNPVFGTIDNRDHTQPMNVQAVSGTYFTTLGVHALIGRTLTDADDQVEGRNPVAVISYAWWTSAVARDPNILGHKIKMGDTTFDIIGIAPPEFFGTKVGEEPDIWVPMTMMALVPPHWSGYHDKRAEMNYIIARLKPGVSNAQATSNVNVVFQQIWSSYMNEHVTPKDLAQLHNTHVPLTPMANGLSSLREEFSQPLKILITLTGIVLLIACANIANLLLARSTARVREFAVRQALGAKRSRLIRQLLTESLLLALTGGALGIGIAIIADHILLRMISRGPDVMPLDVSLNPRLLLFTLGVTIVTALLFGTLPALRATKLDLTESLKDGRGPQSANSKSLLARSLVITQVAFSLILLVGAGLFVRSLVNLNNVDLGFNKQDVLMLNVDPSSIGYKDSDPRLIALYQQIEQRVAAIHGVTAASFSSFTFHQGASSGNEHIPGIDPSLSANVKHDAIGADYFKAMGIPLIAGRTFGPQDTATGQKMAIVSESFAKAFFPNSSPIGHDYTIGDADGPWHMRIIGIVKDVKFQSISEPPQPLDYLYYPQDTQYLQNLVVRYQPGPGNSFNEVSTNVQQVIHSIDRTLPITWVKSLDEQVAGSITQQRTVAELSSFFGLLAVFLSCIGIYGLMSYSVSRRTNEIGIRMALGAERTNVLWLIMREIIFLVAIGIAIGVPVTLASSRLVTTLLFGVKGTDALSIAASVAALLAVGLLAGYLPARRASRTDPMEALRYE